MGTCSIAVVEVVTAGPRGISGTGALPPGGDTGDVLTKLSPADADAAFIAPNRDALTLGGLPPEAYVSAHDFNNVNGSVNNPLCHIPFNNTIAIRHGVGSIDHYRDTTATYTDKYGNFKDAPASEPIFETTGILFENSTTNLFLNSDIAISQAVTVIVGVPYTVSFLSGAGTLSVSGNVNYPDVTAGNPVTFIPDRASINLGSTGDCRNAQFEQGVLQTGYVRTSDEPYTRAQSWADLTSYGNTPNMHSMSIAFDVDSYNRSSEDDPIIFNVQSGSVGAEVYFRLTGVGPVMKLHNSVEDTNFLMTAPNPYPINQGGCRLCITMDASYIKMYSNGALFWTASNTSTQIVNPQMDQPFNFGGFDGASLSGHLKNLKMYDTALDDFAARTA